MKLGRSASCGLFFQQSPRERSFGYRYGIRQEIWAKAAGRSSSAAIVSEGAVGKSKASFLRLTQIGDLPNVPAPVASQPLDDRIAISPASPSASIVATSSTP